MKWNTGSNLQKIMIIVLNGKCRAKWNHENYKENMSVLLFIYYRDVVEKELRILQKRRQESYPGFFKGCLNPFSDISWTFFRNEGIHSKQETTRNGAVGVNSFLYFLKIDQKPLRDNKNLHFLWSCLLRGCVHMNFLYNP